MYEDNILDNENIEDLNLSKQKDDYELYNRLYPGMGEPDSNIVEYAEDILYMINLLIDNK